MHPLISQPGQTVDLMPVDRDLIHHETVALLDSGKFRLLQIHVPAGGKIPRYEAEGEIIVHCIEGHIAIYALEKLHHLKARQLLYLCVSEAFSITALEDSSVTVTIIQPMSGCAVNLVGK